MLILRPFFGYWQRVTLGLWVIALVCFYFADTEIIALDPWSELRLIFGGFIRPDFFATEYLLDALWQTVSFALLGVFLGLVWGGPCSVIYHKPGIAATCAFIRSIHEIFWALLFLQIFGLSPLTGILAIALPYGATFARVFHDILAQAPLSTSLSLPSATDRLSRYLYGKFAHVFAPIRAYIRYRFECALRSSAVLGFVGMPTLGFYLETAFKQGQYHQGAALLMLFILLIGTIPYWCRTRLLPLYFVIAIWALPAIPYVDGQLFWRFISVDILPPMLQGVSSLHEIDASLLSRLCDWLARLTREQALPGILATLLLAIAALAMTHMLAILGEALTNARLSGRKPAWLARAGLLILRSIPEYIFAFVFMLLLGPSMLPAMLALALHNGALIAYLSSRQSDTLEVSASFNGRLDGYGYDILPKIYPNLMGLLFYRFEVILRETAIFGMLGIATLGFYIDSNFSEIRFSGALVLMCFTAALNIVIDLLSRRLISKNLRSQQRC